MGKLRGDIVGEADALTKEGTKIGLPAPGDVFNCALEEVTSKLGPGEEKMDVVRCIKRPARIKLRPESKVR